MRADDHVEDDLVGRVDLGADADEADVVRQDLFEVVEDAGPGDAFAQEELVVEERVFNDWALAGRRSSPSNLASSVFMEESWRWALWRASRVSVASERWIQAMAAR